jgi:hypothetical protein
MAAKRKGKQRVCMLDGCNGKHRGRGLCEPCYQAAKYLVDTNQETWPSLVSQGLAAPVKKKPSKLRRAVLSKRKSVS